MARPVSVRLVPATSATSALPKLHPAGPSLRKTQYRVAPSTAVQDSATDESSAVAVSAGEAAGPPLQPAFWGAGVEQAMPWRSNALNSAVMCGVPSVRSPSSSSAASHCM